ncbi:TPA: ExeA family protein [Photobacterium damselae]
MYQAYFGFHQAPFALTPNTELFHALPPHVEAIQTTLAALTMGEGIIYISGEVGTGKTLVCRMLIQRLPTHCDLAYIPTPPKEGDELKIALAIELGLEPPKDRIALTSQLQHELIRRKELGRSVVVILDEAQALSDDCLETIRLLGNLETEFEKLLQIVLLSQPELDQRLQQHHLRQLQQRITFRAQLRALDLAETVAYIEHRLYQAGCRLPLFSLPQSKLIWQASNGIPRLINQLCHKALIAASSSQLQMVGQREILMAIQDTPGARQPRWLFPVPWGWSKA